MKTSAANNGENPEGDLGALDYIPVFDFDLLSGSGYSWALFLSLSFVSSSINKI